MLRECIILMYSSQICGCPQFQILDHYSKSQYLSLFMYSPFQLRLIEEIPIQRDLFQSMLDDSQNVNFNSQRSSEPSIDFSGISFNDYPTINIPKVDLNPSVSKKEPCTCTKTKCKKGYCPCYKEGAKCGVNCECTSCQNREFIPRRIKYTFGSTEQLALPAFSFSE